MRSLVRQHGRVDPVSERQDTHQGKMIVSAVFQRDQATYAPSSMGTVPPTGTPITAAKDDILDELLQPYRDQLFYLGNVYGSEPRLPMWFKHFGSGAGGAGEAYHIGIFGKTGSGKSVLAKMLLLAYARHREMGLLVIDPQGEFTRSLNGDSDDGFDLRMNSVCDRLSKEVVSVNVNQLVLDRWALFRELLLASGLFRQRLPIGTVEVRERAVDAIITQLRKNTKLTELATDQAFKRAWEALSDFKVQEVIYLTRDRRTSFANQVAEADPAEVYREVWQPLTALFDESRTGARSVDSVLTDLFNGLQGRRPLVVVDLSQPKETAPSSHGRQPSMLDLDNDDGNASVGNILWNDDIQALIISRLLDGIREIAEHSYQDGKTLNTLVLLDEAHRLAPRQSQQNEYQDRIRANLRDAARTTRKYGLGWLFISQTLASLDQEIINQMRIYFFGFGLAMGTEFQSLRGLVGGAGSDLSLYQSFRDPHSAFSNESRQYSFMTTGPVSPLSFSSTPLFFNVFNTPGAYFDANKATFTASVPSFAGNGARP
ncbi:MAG: ATP-binding protein [Chloroflexota bacterium]|nr:ATP-binding protein [Chloroflexota bacterium]MDE2960420.1 ATP-binding protein [Chloroflexota bacterium]